MSAGWPGGAWTNIVLALAELAGTNAFGGPDGAGAGGAYGGAGGAYGGIGWAIGAGRGGCGGPTWCMAVGANPDGAGAGGAAGRCGAASVGPDATGGIGRPMRSSTSLAE